MMAFALFTLSMLLNFQIVGCSTGDKSSSNPVVNSQSTDTRNPDSRLSGSSTPEMSQTIPETVAETNEQAPVSTQEDDVEVEVPEQGKTNISGVLIGIEPEIDEIEGTSKLPAIPFLKIFDTESSDRKGESSEERKIALEVFQTIRTSYDGLREQSQSQGLKLMSETNGVTLPNIFSCAKEGVKLGFRILKTRSACEDVAKNIIYKVFGKELPCKEAGSLLLEQTIATIAACKPLAPAKLGELGDKVTELLQKIPR